MIIINIDKAKLIGHDIRRSAREKEFAPLDEIIAKKIPTDNAASIEAQRQNIRNKYAEIQNSIDSAQTTDEIKSALGI